MTLECSCNLTFKSLQTCGIEIRKGLCFNVEVLKSILISHGPRFAVITDSHVGEIYGKQFCQALESCGLHPFLFSFPAGEKFKTRETKEHLENQMFNRGLGRDSSLIALGGGIVTDIGGYLAATYCRGIPLIMVPTSLIGMVDASMGGKNGVNTSAGKNLIGTIYQPKKILIDPLFLKTLPLAELKSGVVEMIKHGLIADLSYFEFLEEHALKILSPDFSVLEQAIAGSCRIKSAIIEEDACDLDKRRLLNFGHTVGHALESASDYAISHGLAVAMGMLVESYAAFLLGYLELSHYERIEAILAKYSIDLMLPCPISEKALFNAMLMDKKSLSGMPRYTILNAIGAPHDCNGHYCMHIDEKILLIAFQRIMK